MELNQVTRERNDLSNQLTVLGRKKDALNDELVRTRQRLEQANETNARVNRNLEDLVRECEEKQCALDSLDKDMQRLQEQLAGIRSEKEALEAILFDTQTNLEASEAKKFQLETEQQELLVKQEQLKAQIARLTKDLERSEKRCIEVKNSLTQQSGNKEMEFKQTIEKLKAQNEDNTKKLIDEREKIRSTLEKRMQQSLHQLTNEKDAEIQQLLDRIESLQSHIENMVQQHEELMLRAENDKQKALLIGKIVFFSYKNFLQKIKSKWFCAAFSWKCAENFNVRVKTPIWVICGKRWSNWPRAKTVVFIGLTVVPPKTSYLNEN
jgi:rootletin